MAGMKFTYFDLRGRGEITRLVFAYAGKQINEERIPPANWPQEKEKHLFGWLPTLTIEGKGKLCDSMGIAKYVARKFGVGGKDDEEMLQIDMIIGMVSDVVTPLINICVQSDAAKKKELETETYEKTIPKFLTALERIITENGKGEFFVGDSITIADLAVFDMADKMSGDPLAAYPKVKANVARVAANAKIAAYVKSRPETPF